MKKHLKQIMVGGVVGAISLVSGLRTSAIEIIDEKGDKWVDITEAIKEWPLNTFNVMYISEYDLEKNSLSVIFNGIKTDSETGENVGWQADEVMLAWQNYDGIFKRSEFAELNYDELGDRYLPLAYYKFGKPLDSSVEMKIDADRLNGNWMEYFYTNRLAYVMRNSGGDSTRANTNSAFECVAKLQEGQVCRLYYRAPRPDLGASSGLTKYYPVQRREKVVEVFAESEIVEDIKTEVEQELESEVEPKNELDDMKNEVDEAIVSENDEKYSSGDIFDGSIEDDISVSDGGIDGATTSEPEYIRYEVKRSVINNSSTDSASMIASSVNGTSAAAKTNIINAEEKKSDAKDLIATTEALKAGSDEKNREEEIEVPKLGMTAKQIDYKWLFLPILGLVLMIYWWFIVPIWRKRQKNAKKSKKSVDNI